MRRLPPNKPQEINKSTESLQDKSCAICSRGFTRFIFTSTFFLNRNNHLLYLGVRIYIISVKAGTYNGGKSSRKKREKIGGKCTIRDKSVNVLITWPLVRIKSNGALKIWKAATGELEIILIYDHENGKFFVQPT